MFFKKDISVTPKSPKPIKTVETVLHFAPDQHSRGTTSSSPWVSPRCSVQLASHVLLMAPEIWNGAGATEGTKFLILFNFY